jgi:hypothetical protein
LTIHPFLERIQFQPIEKVAARFTVAHHQSLQRNSETLAVGGTILSDRITGLSTDLVDGLEGAHVHVHHLRSSLTENLGSSVNCSA